MKSSPWPDGVYIFYHISFACPVAVFFDYRQVIYNAIAYICYVYVSGLLEGKII